MYGKIKNKLPNLKVSLHTYNKYAYIFMLLLVFGLESWHGRKWSNGQQKKRKWWNNEVKEAVRKRRKCV